MKIRVSSRGLFALGFVILVVTNIVVLAGVASNRSGDPEARLTLTERELELPDRMHEENSGLALQLTWRALGKEEEDDMLYADWRTPAWFNVKKLEELGFNIGDTPSAQEDGIYYKKSMPKEVFIVLEYNGEPYREAVKRAVMSLAKAEAALQLHNEDQWLRTHFEEAEKRLRREQLTESRLFAIDAGPDFQELRKKYADRARFVIARGLVRPTYTYNQERKNVTGYIVRLSVENIHVSLKHRQVFDTILVQDRSSQYNELRRPRYQVELAYGGRLEPWIVSVRQMDDASD